MITTFFVVLGATLLGFLVGFLPVSSGLPAGYGDALITITGAINSMSYVVPVVVVFTMVGIVVGFELLVWSWKGSVWLWKRLTGR